MESVSSIPKKSRRNNSSRRPVKPKEKSIGCGVCGDGDGKYKCPKCRFPYCSVKCCKEHKEKCPAVQNNTKSNNADTVHISCTGIKSNDSNVAQPDKISEYLSAEQLTRDPLENALRRRNMLEEDEDDDEDEWRITREMMDRIDNSEWLRKELSDGGLRQIIAQIDMADDGKYGSRSHQWRQSKRPKLGAVPDLTPREIAVMKAKHTNPKFSNFVDRLLVTAEVLVEGEKTTEQDLASFLLGDSGEQIGMLSLAPVEKKRTRKSNEEMSVGSGGSCDSDSNDDCSDSSDANHSTSSSSS
jgi:hypothetical protein